MADIRPFSAIRPRTDLVQEIAALPYDVYSRKEAYELMKGNQLSFLRIDRPETQFPEEYDMYAPEVYKKAKEMLDEMCQKGEFVKEQAPCYYVYSLTMDGRTQTGIAACASVDDYINEIIKKHENTRADKEADRIRHVDVCDTQTGPIFLAYRENAVITENVNKAMEKTPIYDFVSEDGIRHAVWKIDDAESVKAIQNAFAGMNQIYIADGHHRCASAVKVSLKRREQGLNNVESDHFLSVLFPDEQLKIMSYNRVVKDLNGMSESEFIEKLSDIFAITKKDTQVEPKEKGTVGLYLGNAWYELQIKEEYKNNDPVDGLDVALLQNLVFEPMLAINDPKTDKRIDFVGGIRGIDELERRCNADCVCAFSMYPTSIEELFAVADAGLLMPPKSTWFEPKLRSGLLLHSLEE